MRNESLWTQIIYQAEMRWPDLIQALLQHIQLVFISMLIAIAIGIPLGILITRIKRLEGPVLGIAGILQTIPSLALLG
ncbi:MAG: ABC-type proline/glycine betaine transport system, permease component, partial [Herbinix sp.]|nr:ABC-type proline/glycine betaine transport system, permease component [Herbinix sp.]